MLWILKPFKQLAGVNFLKKVLRQFHNWFTAPIKQRHTLGWHVFRILYWQKTQFQDSQTQSLWIMYEKKKCTHEFDGQLTVRREARDREEAFDSLKIQMIHKWRQENNRGYLYFMLWVWRHTQVCSMPSLLSCTRTKEKGCVCEGQQSSAGWKEVSSVMNLKSIFVRFLQ